jgi:ABC-type antimicrobial peptide transport system permease subunit
MKSFSLRSGSLNLSGAVIANKLADALHAVPGDSIALSVGGRSVDLDVTAVVDDVQGNALYTSNEEVMNINGEGLCQGLFVTTQSIDQARAYAAWAQGHPAVGAIELKEDVATSFRSQLGSVVSLFYAFLVLNMFIAFAVATSAVIITASEKEMEFATMATLGVPKRIVLGSLAVEIGLMAGASALVSIPLSFVLAKGFSVLLEEAVFYIPVELSLGAAVLTLVIGSLFVWTSVIWPLRQNRRLNLERTLRERLP